jgi:hypothetical protein
MSLRPWYAGLLLAGLLLPGRVAAAADQAASGRRADIEFRQLIKAVVIMGRSAGGGGGGAGGFAIRGGGAGGAGGAGGSLERDTDGPTLSTGEACPQPGDPLVQLNYLQTLNNIAFNSRLSFSMAESEYAMRLKFGKPISAQDLDFYDNNDTKPVYNGLWWSTETQRHWSHSYAFDAAAGVWGHLARQYDIATACGAGAGAGGGGAQEQGALTKAISAHVQTLATVGRQYGLLAGWLYSAGQQTGAANAYTAHLGNMLIKAKASCRCALPRTMHRCTVFRATAVHRVPSRRGRRCGRPPRGGSASATTSACAPRGSAWHARTRSSAASHACLHRARTSLQVRRVGGVLLRCGARRLLVRSQRAPARRGRRGEGGGRRRAGWL